MSSVVRSLVGLWLLALAVFSSSQTTALPSDDRPLVPNGRWGLVIGVSGYAPEIGALDFAKEDARDFAGALTHDLGFESDHVRLLDDDKTGTGRPTSANIVANLDAMLADKRLSRANLFVFYFAGHGEATPKGDFLLPIDAAKDRTEALGVPVREVIGKIVKAGLKNVLVLTDACRAGTENDFGTELSLLCRQANLAVMLGCAPGRRSYELPSRGHGAFTYQLLESLHRPELRDAAGALWASRVGEDLRPRVRSSTLDHGAYAQLPTIWGDGSTLDVLLGAYPTGLTSGDAIREFTSKAEKLDRPNYAAALIAYANDLATKERQAEAIDILKTVDGLQELTDEARFLLTALLRLQGRTGEADRQFDAFAKGSGGFWRDFAVATSGSRSFDYGARQRAALALFDASETFPVRLMATDAIAEVGDSDQRLRYARLLAATPGMDPRQKAYAEGYLRWVEGRFAQAADLMAKSRALPGESPDDDALISDEIGIRGGIRDLKSLDSLLASVEARPFWRVRADILRAKVAIWRNDPTNRVALLKKALAAEPNADEVWLAARVAGAYLGSLREELKAAAAKHPYSWQARLVLMVCDPRNADPSVAEKALGPVIRFSDSPLTFNVKLFEFYEDTMIEEVELGTLAVEAAQSQLERQFFDLLAKADQFGDDPDVWQMFVRFGMTKERGDQVARIMRRLKLAPEAMPRELRSSALTAAINRGDHATVTRLAAGPFSPDEGTTPDWVYATYLVGVGKEEQALALVKRLDPPGPEMFDRGYALETLLAALMDSRREEARKRLSEDSSTEPVVDALHGISWAVLGDWKRAEPLLQEQSVKRTWAFLPLQALAIQLLADHYRATGRAALAYDLAFNAAFTQPGNPVFARQLYGPKPGLAQFVGTLVFDGLTSNDAQDDDEGKLTISVAADGALSGVYSPMKGQTLTMKGKVDAYGNVTGLGQWQGKRYEIGAKLAPHALYATFPRFRTVGQVFHLIDDKGYRVVLAGKTPAHVHTLPRKTATRRERGPAIGFRRSVQADRR